jgi:hypothetical protein
MIALVVVLMIMGVRSRQLPGTPGSVEQEYLSIAREITELEVNTGKEVSRLRARLAQLEPLYQERAGKEQANEQGTRGRLNEDTRR